MNDAKRKIVVRKVISVTVSIVFFLEGMMFYNQYTYAYHVDKADSQIAELKNLLEEGCETETGLKASVLSTFTPDNSNEAKIALSKKIVNSTENAIENADEIKKVEKLKRAVDDIKKIQDSSINIIQDVKEDIEDEKSKELIAGIYDQAIDLQEKVIQASEVLDEASKEGKKLIKINIITSKDKNNIAYHHDANKHQEDVKKNSKAPIVYKSANYKRVEEKKVEDAKVRSANRNRLKLIDKGDAYNKSQEIKKRIEAARKNKRR